MVGIPTASVDVEVYNGKGVAEKRSVTFKSLRYVPTGIIRNMRHNPQAQAFAILEWAVDEKGLVTVDLMPSYQVLDLLDRMQQASEVDLGESSGSSESSTSTARRSKRTSSISD